jgi:glycerol-3-phosphate dehydrogenase
VIAGFRLQHSEIVEVLAGRLPPQAIGSHLPRKSPTIRRHAVKAGFTTIEGVKYTTARSLAEQTLVDLSHRPPPTVQPSQTAVEQMSAHDLLQFTQHESVVHIDDLLLRRTDTLVRPEELVRLGTKVLNTLNWDSNRTKKELDRLKQHCVAKEPHH